MPVYVKDVMNGAGNIIWGEGIVTNEEYLETVKTHLTQDPEKFSKYRFGVVDFSAINSLQVSTIVLKIASGLCSTASKLNPEAVVAHVTPDTYLYNLTRQYFALSDEIEWEEEVFHEQKEAELWIIKRMKEKFGIEHVSFE